MWLTHLLIRMDKMGSFKLKLLYFPHGLFFWEKANSKPSALMDSK